MDVQNVSVDLINVGQRYRKDLGNIAELEQSIEALGLLQPIGVTSSWKLVWGGRRLQAFRNLGRAEIPAMVFDMDKLLHAELDENITHLPMKMSERTALAKAIELELKARTGERRGNPNLKKNAKTPSKPNSPQMRGIATPEKGEETAASVSKQSGFNNDDEYRRAKLVDDNCPQVIKDMIDDKAVSISDAASVAELPAEIQEKAAEKVLHGTAKTLKKAAQIAETETNADAGLREPQKDENGIPIPDNVLVYVDDIALMDEVLAIAKNLRFKLNEFDKCPTSNHGGQHGHLQSYCKPIEVHMKRQRFAFVCPKCRGIDDKECECCMGRRFFQECDRDKINVKKYLKTA